MVGWRGLTLASRDMTGLKQYNPQTSKRKSSDWFTLLFSLKHQIIIYFTSERRASRVVDSLLGAKKTQGGRGVKEGMGEAAVRKYTEQAKFNQIRNSSL